MKSTKYYQIALDRLVERLGVKVQDAPDAPKSHLKIDLRDRLPEQHRADEWLAAGWVYVGSKKYLLARLVMIAQEPPPIGFGLTLEEVQDAMKLTHVSGDGRGLRGHEWQSLKAAMS